MLRTTDLKIKGRSENTKITEFDNAVIVRLPLKYPAKVEANGCSHPRKNRDAEPRASYPLFQFNGAPAFHRIGLLGESAYTVQQKRGFQVVALEYQFWINGFK